MEQIPGSSGTSRRPSRVWVVALVISAVALFVFVLWKYCIKPWVLSIGRRSQARGGTNVATNSRHPQATPNPVPNSRGMSHRTTDRTTSRPTNYLNNRYYGYQKGRWRSLNVRNTGDYRDRQDVPTSNVPQPAWYDNRTNLGMQQTAPFNLPHPAPPPGAYPQVLWPPQASPVVDHSRTTHLPANIPPTYTPLPSRPPPAPSPERTQSSNQRSQWNEIRMERRRAELRRPSLASLAVECPTTPETPLTSSGFTANTLVGSGNTTSKVDRENCHMEQIEIDDTMRFDYDGRQNERSSSVVQWILETLGVFQMGRLIWRPGREQ